jgi:hypothetical protein
LSRIPFPFVLVKFGSCWSFSKISLSWPSWLIFRSPTFVTPWNRRSIF